MDKLTIYCCYHDKSQKKNDDVLTKWFYGPSGLLNPYLSEFSMFYDIWKNDNDSDYIGTCHYGRRIYSWNFDKKLVNENSCQVYEIIKGNKYSGFFGVEKWSSKKHWNCHRLWDDYKDYLGNIGGGNLYLEKDSNLSKAEYFMISKSSVILTRDSFMNMCGFIFGFLDYLDKKYVLNYDLELYDKWIMEKYLKKYYGGLLSILGDRILYKKRLLAYLFEWLVSIYIQTNIDSYHVINPNNIIQIYPWTGGKLEYLINCIGKLNYLTLRFILKK